jgi:hypothetical protein
MRASFALWRANILPAQEQEELRSILDWFNERLAKPKRLSVSRHSHPDSTAISWMRTTAHEHLRRLRQLAVIVESSGTAVDELRTSRPGYVVYEDGHQVVALPFANTPR